MAYDEPMPTPDGNTVSTMTEWEAYWVGGLGGASGVVAGKLGELAPSINSGSRTVSTATGAAFVRGFYVQNPSTAYTASVPAQSVGDRVDRLVLRLDRTASVAANWLKPVILQGSSGSSTPPSLQSSDTGSYDEPIARWTTKADGSLTGLVDERRRSGGQFLVFNSTARPSASPPRQGYELDTGKPVYANGSQWNYYEPDTGWVTFAPTGSWKVGDLVNRVRRVGNVVQMAGAFIRTTSSLASGSVSTMANLPAGFAPTLQQHNWMAWTADGGARVRLGTDGVLAVVDVTATLAVNHAVYLDTSWLVG